MKFLLVHQNFPGQFRQLAPYLAKQGHELVAICSHQRPVHFNGSLLRYQEPKKPTSELSLGSTLWNEGLERANLVARLCDQLKKEGWVPDRILGHTGWGETIALKEVWPEVPQILWPELWVLPEHGGHGIDPEMSPPGLEERLTQLGRNALTSFALDQASAWVVPTQHQANSFPKKFQTSNMHVVHEGIDTNIACPKSDIQYEVRGVRITRETPTITFVNRNLERLRGFDTFMLSLVEILRNHETVRIIIVGDSERGYGGTHPSGRPLREVMLEKLKDELDLNRIHFLGRIPHPQLIGILQASWVHVYLSYPFVLGWSLLEAMSCGCCIVGSTGMPVQEVIQNGIHGILVPIDNHKILSDTTLALLDNSSLRQKLGNSAREIAKEWDQSILLPKLKSILE